MNTEKIWNNRFNIGIKLKISFLILIGVIVLNGFYTSSTLKDSTVLLDKISNDVNPTIQNFVDFRNLIKDSRAYATNWVYVSRYENDKEKLREIHSKLYPSLNSKLLQLVETIEDKKEAKNLAGLIASFENILTAQKEVMDNLNSTMAYEDVMTLFMCEDLIKSTVIPKSDALVEKLDQIIEQKTEQSDAMQLDMQNSFANLNWTIIILGIIGVLFGLTIAYYLSGIISNPVRILKDRINKLSKGIIPKPIEKFTNDEIGEISHGVNSLIDGFKYSSEFANQIRNGNLEAEFTALSSEDALGHALISMRDNLKNVIRETHGVVDAAGHEGRLGSRISLIGKEGAWEELSSAINNLLHSISTTIMEIKSIVKAMAAGDLTHRYLLDASGDILSLTQNLNGALENLNGFIYQITTNANTLDDSSSEMLVASEEMNINTGEIASAIAEMSSGAQTQLRKVDESSSLIEVILNSAKDMGQKAESINQGVKDAVTNSETGREMLDGVVSKMADISGYSNKTNDSIKVLTGRSNEITRVLSVITEIAAQTNLLALNAAIEAAQAGDAGRGFAVVAEEIKKLAEDSKNSALEIEILIEGVQVDTSEAATIIEEMNKSVETGEQASIEAVEMFKEIGLTAADNLVLSEQILSASHTQKKNINEIVTNTESVVVVAEQTATGTEQVASSATELSAGMQNYMQKSRNLTHVAAELKNGVRKFKFTKTSGISNEGLLGLRVNQKT